MKKESAPSKLQGGILIILYTAFLFMLSLAIALMPVASANKWKMRWLLTLNGVMLWLGVVGVAVMAIVITVHRRKNSKFKKVHPEKKRIGLINFFENIYAIIADILMGVSAVAFITVTIFAGNVFLMDMLLGIFVFSFGMHCMLNGINFVYINYLLGRNGKK